MMTNDQALPPWLHRYATLTLEELYQEVATAYEEERERCWKRADCIATMICRELALGNKADDIYIGWPGTSVRWAKMLARLGRIFPPDVRDMDKSLKWYEILAQIAQKEVFILRPTTPVQWSKISEHAVFMYEALADEPLANLLAMLYAAQGMAEHDLPGLAIDTDNMHFTAAIEIREGFKWYLIGDDGTSQPFSPTVLAKRLGHLGHLTLTGEFSGARHGTATADLLNR